MGYGEHLRNLLQPLGIYNLTPGSLSGSLEGKPGGGLNGYGNIDRVGCGRQNPQIHRKGHGA